MSLSRRYFQMGNAANATPPTIPTFDLHILAGQSNTGNTSVSTMTTPQATLYKILVPNTNIYNPATPHGTPTSTFQQMNEGINTGITNEFSTDVFGPEAAWFVQLQGLSAKTRYLFKYGVGNTALATDWNSVTPLGAKLYQNLTNYLDAMLLVMIPNNIVPVLKSFVWMQGEADANDVTMSANYQTNLQNFFNNFKTFWASRVTSYSLPSANNNFLTIIPQINAPGETYRTTVQAAEAAYAAIGGNNAIAYSTTGYSNSGGSLHYDATGLIQFGTDLFNYTKSL